MSFYVIMVVLCNDKNVGQNTLLIVPFTAISMYTVELFSKDEFSTLQ